MLREISGCVNSNDSDRLRLVVAKAVEGYTRPDADRAPRRMQQSKGAAVMDGSVLKQ